MSIFIGTNLETIINDITINNSNFSEYFDLKKWYKTSSSNDEISLTNNTYIANNSTSDNAIIDIGTSSSTSYSKGYTYGFTLYPKKNIILKPKGFKFNQSKSIRASERRSGYYISGYSYTESTTVYFHDNNTNKETTLGTSSTSGTSSTPKSGSVTEQGDTTPGGYYYRVITTTSSPIYEDYYYSEYYGGTAYVQIHWYQDSEKESNPYEISYNTSSLPATWPDQSTFHLLENTNNTENNCDSWIKIYYKILSDSDVTGDDEVGTTYGKYGVQLNSIIIDKDNSKYITNNIDSSNLDKYFILKKWMRQVDENGNFLLNEDGTFQEEIILENNKYIYINSFGNIQIGNNKTVYVKGYAYGFSLYPLVSMKFEPGKQDAGYYTIRNGNVGLTIDASKLNDTIDSEETVGGEYQVKFYYTSTTNSSKSSPQTFPDNSYETSTTGGTYPPYAILSLTANPDCAQDKDHVEVYYYPYYNLSYNCGITMSKLSIRCLDIAAQQILKKSDSSGYSAYIGAKNSNGDSVARTVINGWIGDSTNHAAPIFGNYKKYIYNLYASTGTEKAYLFYTITKYSESIPYEEGSTNNGYIYELVTDSLKEYTYYRYEVNNISETNTPIYEIADYKAIDIITVYSGIDSNNDKTKTPFPLDKYGEGYYSYNGEKVYYYALKDDMTYEYKLYKYNGDEKESESSLTIYFNNNDLSGDIKYGGEKYYCELVKTNYIYKCYNYTGSDGNYIIDIDSEETVSVPSEDVNAPIASQSISDYSGENKYYIFADEIINSYTYNLYTYTEKYTSNLKMSISGDGSNITSISINNPSGINAIVVGDDRYGYYGNDTLSLNEDTGAYHLSEYITNFSFLQSYYSTYYYFLVQGASSYLALPYYKYASDSSGDKYYSFQTPKITINSDSITFTSLKTAGSSSYPIKICESKLIQTTSETISDTITIYATYQPYEDKSYNTYNGAEYYFELQS